MKQCPKCGQYFGDENAFCLYDGTPLMLPQSGSSDFDASGEIQTQYIPRQQPAPSPPASGNGLAKWLFLVIGMLVATIAVGGYLAFIRKPDEQGTKKQISQNINADPSPAGARSPEPAQTPVPPAPTATSWTKPPLAPTPPPPPRPSITTSRVKFAQGAVTSSVSGSLSEGDVKNYLLACRAGQQLTAAISSSDRCITFTDGSTIFRSYTSKGDNTLSVTNRCSPRGSYRLEITIL